MSEQEFTEEEAQVIHDQRREAEPDHDMCGCWCCCWTCDFDTRAIMMPGHNDEQRWRQVIEEGGGG